MISLQDKIYTYMGDILLSVNPFRPLPLYDEETSSHYKMARRGMLPPHVFAIADTAYTDLLRLKKNLCCIISGESGAGGRQC